MTLKIAVLAPMPRPSVTIANVAKSGLRRSVRRAKRMFCASMSMMPKAEQLVCPRLLAICTQKLQIRSTAARDRDASVRLRTLGGTDGGFAVRGYQFAVRVIPSGACG